MDFSYKQSLVERIESKNAVIGIVGLGYVGLPLLLCGCEAGYRVIGFDVDDKKISTLAAGNSYIEHIESGRVQAQAGQFEATNDFSRALEADILVLCVPTPLDEHREPDLQFITSTMAALKPYFRAGQLLCLESTTYPGTTDEVLAPQITASDLAIGETFFLAFSPEREDPGNANFNTRTIPKVCGGYSKACLEVSTAFYRQVVDKVVPVSSTRVAEMTKVLENIHRAVNIGLVNEMKIVADKMEIDIHEVIRAAATKPFGFVPYTPGPGLGGHCIPIDPFYLTWKAREYGLHTRFIELAGEINAAMPDYVISKVISGLNQRQKAVSGSEVLVLGISYKKNIDDMRESPSVILMEKLQALGATVSYSDPHVPVFPRMRKHYFELSSVALNPDELMRYDCVVLATDHDDFDYAMIKGNASLIIDCRGRYTEKSDMIISA